MKKITHIYNQKGFSLIEIILALAISVIVFIAVFQFITTTYIRLNTTEKEQTYASYIYGEPYCLIHAPLQEVVFSEENSISLSSYISTSTKLTSIHPLSDTQFLITTDSASTTESDVFLFDINMQTKNILLQASRDIGPGIQDSKLLDHYLYVANTSVNSHVKVLYIDTEATGTGVFREISNTVFPTLSQSLSNPKKLSVNGEYIILGSEKSNTGPELFVLPRQLDGAVRVATKTIELGGQLNQSLSMNHSMFVANAADPELRLFDQNLREHHTYDAPLTLGNGKSVLYIKPYIVFGRTLGSGELSLLEPSATTTYVLDIKRTNGSVDFIQRLQKEYDVQNIQFLTMTANESKELQFWNLEKTFAGAKLTHQKDINPPGRVTGYACADTKLLMLVSLNNQPTLLWIHM